MFCMGEIGILLWILCGKFGVLFIYVIFLIEWCLVLGMFSVNEMCKFYWYEVINCDIEVFGVIVDLVE